MKNFITVLFLAFSMTFVNAQNAGGGTDISDGFKIFRSKVQGHQYLLEKWVPGFLVDMNGKVSEKKLLNYDIKNNFATYKTSNQQKEVMVINSDLYSGFLLTGADNKRYLFSKIAGDAFKKPKKMTKFYQLINSPSKRIILESKKNFKDPNASGWAASNGSSVAAKYTLSKSLYVLNRAGKYVKIKASASSLTKALKDKKKELRNYIKSNNISIKNASDLIPVVDYYHSL